MVHYKKLIKIATFNLISEEMSKVCFAFEHAGINSSKTT